MSNQPAFPVHPNAIDGLDHFGMTLRDYFAAKAMQAIVSDATMIAEFGSNKEIAMGAYKLADAMMEARLK